MSGLKLFLVHKRQSQMSKLERQSKKNNNHHFMAIIQDIEITISTVILISQYQYGDIGAHYMKQF